MGDKEPKQASLQNDIVHQGWLFKKGRIHKNWTRRWFVLYRKNTLSYFSQPTEVLPPLPIFVLNRKQETEMNKKARKKQAKGSIKLQYCTFVPDGMQETGYFFSFIVCFGDGGAGGVGLGNAGRNYAIRATKDHDYRSWVDLLMVMLYSPILNAFNPPLLAWIYQQCCKGESLSESKALHVQEKRERRKRKKNDKAEKKKKNTQLQKGFYQSIKAKALSPRATK